jgi:predicted MPP superfamily phosphohydrolase
LGVLCIAYGALVEPYWPQVTHERISSRKLHSGSRPVRIVHISDLHCDARPRLEERLPELIRADRPDIIVFTGDAINAPSGLPIFRHCMKKLATIAPTYAVRGNWDTWYWSDLDLYANTGVHELRGEGLKTEFGGTPFWVAGSPAWSEETVGGALAGAPPSAFQLFLYHYPDAIQAISQSGVDLYCAGHTHGGQIALPFYGALITLSKYGKRFESGLHRVGASWLNVSRGIGMEGGRAPRVRFCARPEITVIEVVPAS